MEKINNEERIGHRDRIFIIIIFVGIIMLVITSVFSMTQGAAKISLTTISDVFFRFDETNPKHLLIKDMRIPRVIVAATVGCALAVAGALMQGITRNPMADSGLMGINSGAVFVVALTMGVLHQVSYTQMVILAFLGSGASALFVFGISEILPGGNKPMKLILAGATTSILLTSVSQAISIITNISQNLSFWTMGSVSGSQWKHVAVSVPIVLVTVVIAILIANQITIISMGNGLAQGLGVSVGKVRGIGLTTVVILAGISVSLAGMISFVGLMIPHFVRHFLGPDYRYIIPASAIYGALLLVLADLFSKTINAPAEIPIGTLISVIGVPVFIYVARRKKGVIE